MGGGEGRGGHIPPSCHKMMFDRCVIDGGWIDGGWIDGGGFGSGGWIDSGGWVVGVVDACIGVRVNVIIAVALYFFHPHIQA